MTPTTDPLVGLVGFARALREAGLPCDPHRVQAYLAAAGEVDVASPVQLYWAGRVTLCADPDDLPRYDTAFEAWFRDTRRPPATSTQVTEPTPSRIAALTPTPAGSGSDDEETPELHVAASDTEVLRQRDLSELSDAEREHLRSLLALLHPVAPKRRALRQAPNRRGDPDPRATLRRMLRAGGEPVALPRRRAGTRARKVVLLVDVSGSMAPYADALLRFAHVVTRRMPAEVFTLGTRLTRITRALRQRDPERALSAASRAVPDYSGGTRLGETLRVFLDRWGQRGAARRAVVVVFSDGWERGDAAALAEQMARLRRLAHKVLWVNPHAGRAGYAPVQGGIVAVLPHVDRLLAGHSLATLERLLEEVRSA
ncbi:MAG: VWA domain-containing protein [Pseudonocardiaceae bacterium]|nr:VWA domain-containing protein [Pseudonocardiaceae bacterium]